MSGLLDLLDGVPTLDTGERSEFDFYETPAWMTRSLLHFHPAIEGRNAIVRVLRDGSLAPQIFTNDIDPRHPAETHHDARLAEYWASAPAVDWVITNPPFVDAFPILVHAFTHARVGVALLVRKTFLEPTEERGEWLSAHPPTHIIGQPRHSFRGSGSDTVACDWMIWRREPDAHNETPFVIDHLAKSRRAVTS